VQVTDPEHEGSTSDILISIVISLQVVHRCRAHVFVKSGDAIAGYHDVLWLRRRNFSLSSTSGIDLVNGCGPFILLNAVLCHYFVVKLSWFDVYTAKHARHTTIQ
jgi:hypothetical protein